jgi:hypothetical protein
MKCVVRVAAILIFSISITAFSSEDSDQSDQHDLPQEYDLKVALGKAVLDQIKYGMDKAMGAMTPDEWEQFNKGDFEGLERRMDEHSSVSGDSIGIGAYVATDFTVEKAATWMRRHKSVQRVTNMVPKQHRTFFYNTGKRAVSSTFSRGVRIFAEKGTFGYDDARQLGVNAKNIFIADGVNNYVAAPAANYFFGTENSWSKTGSQWIIGTAVVFVINKAGQAVFN